jgi:tetratricopeptide (TPR) repeat protein
MGRYDEAEHFHQQSLSIREKALGMDDESVASSFNNLAVLYKTLKRYNEAESCYQRSLMIREKALGPEHLDVAISLNNLVLLYDSQCRNSEAKLVLTIWGLFILNRVYITKPKLFTKVH